MKKGSDAKKQAVRTFAKGIREMFAAKAARGQAPATDLGKFIDLLGAANWFSQRTDDPITHNDPLPLAYAGRTCGRLC